ncbi:hypothetical protein LCGC14_2068170 [marine sediment metagenome]|uniref:Uncharacterized protein n=1 Tax=marine sediment metagenome TaxID=412755 RepID=A0A0F9HG81_9ZZZZ
MINKGRPRNRPPFTHYERAETVIKRATFLIDLVASMKPFYSSIGRVMAKKSNRKSRKLAKEFTAMAERILVKESKAERERRITAFEKAIHSTSKPPPQMRS